MIKTLIFYLFCVQSSFAASFLTTKTDVCQSLMATLVEFHKNPLNKKKTNQALKFLSEFKDFYIFNKYYDKPLVEPSLKNVKAFQNSSAKKYVKVAKRIQGLLKIHEMKIQTNVVDDMANQDDLQFIGVTLQGAEIDEFFNGVEENIKYLKSTNEYPGLYSTMNLLNFVLVNKLYEKMISGQLSEFEILTTPILFVGMQLIFQAWAYPKELIFLTDKKYHSFIKKIKKKHLSARPGDWFYQSFDMKLNSRAVHEILEKGRVNHVFVPLLNLFNKSSYFSNSHTASRFQDIEMMKKKLVLVDMLYLQDEVEGEVVSTLTLMMRIQRKKPILPKSRPVHHEKKNSNVVIPDGDTISI
ncbi:MAG: hypothetical protein H6622_09290 [Halobacteriovoraceae bacterium]|nr:hypothetical protein [Halobacteriovoraceae bacterium]